MDSHNCQSFVGLVYIEVGLPSSYVFPRFVYTQGRATLGGGSPCLLGRVTPLEGLTFYHVKDQGRVTLLKGLLLTIGLLSHSHHL